MIRLLTAVCITLLAAAFCASGAEIVFAGITREGAPSFEKEFDRLLRENLLSTPGISMVDNESALMLGQKIDLAQYPSLSRGLVERMTDYIPDTTVLIWGRVRNYTVRTVRKNLLWASVTADLTITLNIYSLRFERYAFAGDLTAHAEVSKGLIWFYPIDKLVHVTATDRADLTALLVNTAAMRGAQMIGAVVRSEVRKVEQIEGARRYEDPAVAKVFEHPSMQAPAVDSLKRTAPASDSTVTAGDSSMEKAPAKAQKTPPDSTP